MKTPSYFVASLSFLALIAVNAPHAVAASSIVVSIPDQTLALVDHGTPLARFPISTSRFGFGDRPDSYATPLGSLEVASKIGANAPLGTVFKARVKTGEILPPNARGRDPIVTRILWLRGLESCNARAFQRNIYIHGTPVERLLGCPVSYGCIGMRSRDVAALFAAVNVGTRIVVANKRLPDAVAQLSPASSSRNRRLASN